MIEEHRTNIYHVFCLVRGDKQYPYYRLSRVFAKTYWSAAIKGGLTVPDKKGGVIIELELPGGLVYDNGKQIVAVMYIGPE